MQAGQPFQAELPLLEDLLCRDTEYLPALGQFPRLTDGEKYRAREQEKDFDEDGDLGDGRQGNRFFCFREVIKKCISNLDNPRFVYMEELVLKNVRSYWKESQRRQCDARCIRVCLKIRSLFS